MSGGVHPVPGVWSVEKASLSAVTGKCQGERRPRMQHWTWHSFSSVWKIRDECKQLFSLSIKVQYWANRKRVLRWPNEKTRWARHGTASQATSGKVKSVTVAREAAWLWWWVSLTPAGEWLPDCGCEGSRVLVPKGSKILPGHLQVCPRGRALNQLSMPLPEFHVGREMDLAVERFLVSTIHRSCPFPNQDFTASSRCPALCYLKVSRTWKVVPPQQHVKVGIPGYLGIRHLTNWCQGMCRVLGNFSVMFVSEIFEALHVLATTIRWEEAQELEFMPWLWCQQSLSEPVDREGDKWWRHGGLLFMCFLEKVIDRI